MRNIVLGMYIFFSLSSCSFEDLHDERTDAEQKEEVGINATGSTLPVIHGCNCAAEYTFYISRQFPGGNACLKRSCTDEVMCLPQSGDDYFDGKSIVAVTDTMSWVTKPIPCSEIPEDADVREQVTLIPIPIP